MAFGQVGILRGVNRALASTVQGQIHSIESLLKGKKPSKTVTGDSLASGGKLAPAGNNCANGKDCEKCSCGKSKSEEIKSCQKGDCPHVSKSQKFLVEIAKSSDEEQTVSGVVLQPEVVDAQGDIYSAEVIKQAAYKFLANYRAASKLGKQHKDFKNWEKRMALVESYLAPMEFVLGTKIVKAGSWIMTVKVLDAKIWKAVKEGNITGFSIGGVAKVQTLAA